MTNDLQSLPSTYVSARDASAILVGAGLTRERARRVLLAGFAGAGLQTRGFLLYEERAVRELAGRPHVDESLLADICSSGLFVTRLGLGAAADLATVNDGADLRCAANPTHALPTMTRLFVRTRVQQRGSVPWIATLCGFVVSGGDIVGVHPSQGRTALELTEPRRWFDSFAGHRFMTGRGRPWVLWPDGWMAHADRRSADTSRLRE